MKPANMHTWHPPHRRTTIPHSGKLLKFARAEGLVDWFYQGRKVLYVEEGSGGCTGNYEFHRETRSLWARGASLAFGEFAKRCEVFDNDRRALDLEVSANS